MIHLWIQLRWKEVASLLLIMILSLMVAFSHHKCVHFVRFWNSMELVSKQMRQVSLIKTKHLKELLMDCTIILQLMMGIKTFLETLQHCSNTYVAQIELTLRTKAHKKLRKKCILDP